ncbi:hypothetical protein Ate02nite_27390 [Paractinoplanes tereljensis]|uniref:Uncharacterized protein n=2 Tax=Paractinoplanes tereljensis TaxID=571912 RepID=A0A919NL61_9ACTN|nr:hypothetical protein Ate02nite_27390 [Actinoplanes tereljensis]
MAKLAPFSCTNIEYRVDKAIEDAKVSYRIVDRKKDFNSVFKNARKQAVQAWLDAYRDPIDNKLDLEDLQRGHRKRFPPVTHDALLKLDPVDQWVYLLRTLREFNRFETMKITGLKMWKVDRVLVRAERRINGEDGPKE